MWNGKIRLSLAAIFIFSALSACAFRAQDIILTDAKMATAVDENLMPIKITDLFPKETAKVSCWIKWRDSKINAQLLAKWHYVTDDTHILDYLFTIPKKEGMGSVTLSMPEGKKLPPGLYKVDLVSGNRVLKSLTYKIE